MSLHLAVLPVWDEDAARRCARADLFVVLAGTAPGHFRGASILRAAEHAPGPAWRRDGVGLVVGSADLAAAPEPTLLVVLPSADPDAWARTTALRRQGRVLGVWGPTLAGPLRVHATNRFIWEEDL